MRKTQDYYAIISIHLIVIDFGVFAFFFVLLFGYIENNAYLCGRK